MAEERSKSGYLQVNTTECLLLQTVPPSDSPRHSVKDVMPVAKPSTRYKGALTAENTAKSLSQAVLP